jgi:hypothetical protein
MEEGGVWYSDYFVCRQRLCGGTGEACLPGRKVARALLAREERKVRWTRSPVSCLPGKKVVRALACPGGARSWIDQDSIASVLLAREESGPCVLACPGGGLARESLLGFHTKTKPDSSQRALARQVGSPSRSGGI